MSHDGHHGDYQMRSTNSSTSRRGSGAIAKTPVGILPIATSMARRDKVLRLELPGQLDYMHFHRSRSLQVGRRQRRSKNDRTFAGRRRVGQLQPDHRCGIFNFGGSSNPDACQPKWQVRHYRQHADRDYIHHRYGYG